MLLTVRVVVDGGVVDARADRCYDYAVKMMFLYSAESTLHQIQSAMERELLPARLDSETARQLTDIWENGSVISNRNRS